MVRGERQNLRPSLRESDQWRFDVFSQKASSEIDRRFQVGGIEKDGKLFRHSHSGAERNHLFLNNRGKTFADISPVSGLDTASDSRSFVLWDFDRDGWQDIAMVNANTPLLNLFRNEMGRWDGSPVQGRMIAIRFVGGNDASGPSDFACRDGYGAMVEVTLPDMTIRREHRCGEGFAAQNSPTLIVGIGPHDVADSVTVQWPSRIKHTIKNVPAGTLLTAYEKENAAPHGSAFLSSPYVTSKTRSSPARAKEVDDRIRLLLPPISNKGPAAPAGDDARLRMFTSMATWCAACKQQLPQIALLRSRFAEHDLAMYGVPLDETDNQQTLNQYIQQNRPAYEMLIGLETAERAMLEAALEATLPAPVLPSTIVTDRQGRVLKGISGVPTVSEVERLLTRDDPPPQHR